jgi:hypothetical protein
MGINRVSLFNVRRLLVLSALMLAAVLVTAAPAVATGFTINACQADRANYSSQAFDAFATRGMMWKRACDPEGPGLRGLVTANVVRSGRVPRGSRSYFVMRAPDGTRFGRLTWSGQARRRDCRYALQLWASRPDGPPVPIKNVRANRHCPKRGYAQAAGWPRARNYDIAGATSIVQRVVCVGSKKKRFCSSRGLNYIRTFKAQATVVDTSPPAVSIIQDNPFTRGEWVSGVQTVSYDAWDNTGVRLTRPLFWGASYGDSGRSCDYSQRVPCTSGRGSVPVDTSALAEGAQPLVLQAEDAAGNTSDSAPAVVRIDNTAPGAAQVITVGGTGWRNRNRFEVTWHNADEPDRAPITKAHYRVCRVGGSTCASGSRSGLNVQRLGDLSVPGPGEWQVRVWREDAATNHEVANASVPVPLRYDPEPPALSFVPRSQSDPTAIAVRVKDEVSGLADGTIELSKEGSNIWQTLATELRAGHLEARIDDASLASGTYLLRATARDHAGNQSTTDQTSDGQVMTISLPLRIPTALAAGIVTSKMTRRTVRRRPERRTVRRRIEVLKSTRRVAFGTRVVVRGGMKTTDGHPVTEAPIHVYAGNRTAPDQLVGVVRTDKHGRYVYPTFANASHTLRFVFAGTALMLPAQDEVSLTVRASSTIRVHPKRLLNGQAVRFTGRLRSVPIPPTGKLIELQVVLSGRWQTFRTALAGSNGRWSSRYRFRRSCGLVRYRFRARLPSEAGYGFETGLTRAVEVLVRGRPCA